MSHCIKLFYVVGRRFEDADPKTDLLLWDTVTNEFKDGSAIPGLEAFKLFRPVIGKIGDSSIILVGARVDSDLDSDNQHPLQNIWKYDYSNDGGAWTEVRASPDHLSDVTQNGVYILSNPDLGMYKSLLKCKV